MIFGRVFPTLSSLWKDMKICPDVSKICVFSIWYLSQLLNLWLKKDPIGRKLRNNCFLRHQDIFQHRMLLCIYKKSWIKEFHDSWKLEIFWTSEFCSGLENSQGTTMTTLGIAMLHTPVLSLYWYRKNVSNISSINLTKESNWNSIIWMFAFKKANRNTMLMIFSYPKKLLPYLSQILITFFLYQYIYPTAVA